MKTKNIVSIIIPCFNELEFTKICIKSILKYTSFPYELIVIDNGSSDGTGKYFKELKNRLLTGGKRKIQAFKSIISKRNLGVSGALNRGIKMSNGKYVCYLNNDVIVTTGWLEGLVRCAESDIRIGIVGCAANSGNYHLRLFSSSPGLRNISEIQKTAMMLSLKKERRYMETNFIIGMCMFIKREVINRIGLFDERFYPCSMEDLDYSLRTVKAGFKLVNTKNVFIYHFHARSTKSKAFNENYGNIETVTEKTKKMITDKWKLESKTFKKYFLRPLEQ